MDNPFSAMFSFLTYWVLGAGLVGILFRIFLPMIKGKLGEKYIRDDFKKYLVEPYVLVNDVTLPDN
nr:hypothetical protein [Acinetobacter wanghuae]